MIICGKKFNEKICVSVLLALFFLYNAIVGMQQHYPYIMPDEAGPLGAAAFFAGEDWSGYLSEVGYYGYGQALLYVPIFLLTETSVIRSLFVTGINAMLTALIFTVSYSIFRRQIHYSANKSCFFAILSAIFPTFVLYSKFMWNEPMLGLLPWVVLWVVLELYQNKKFYIPGSIILAFLCVYSYAVHGRGLAILAAVFALITGIWILKKRMLVSPLFFLIALVVVYLVHNYLYTKFLTELWLLNPGETVNNTMGSTSQKILMRLNVDGVKSFFLGLSGAIYVTVCSTFGMVAFFIVFVVSNVKTFFLNKRSMPLSDNHTDRQREPLSISVGYVALFFMCACGISVIALNGHTGDYLIYTRYYANAMGMVAVFGFVFLYEKMISCKGVWASLFLNLFGIACGLIIADQCGFGRPAVYINVYPFMNVGSGRELLTLSCITVIVVLFIVCMAYYGRRKTIYATLLILSLYSYGYTANKYIFDCYTSDSLVRTLAEVINSYEGLEERYPNVVVCDSVNGIPGRLQYGIPQYQVSVFDSQSIDEYEFPKNCMVVAPKDFYLEEFYEPCYQLDDDRLYARSRNIWFYGDELKDYMVSEYGVKVISYAEQYTYDIGEEENFIITNFNGNEGTYRWTTGESTIGVIVDGSYDYTMQLKLSSLPPLEKLGRDSLSVVFLVNETEVGTCVITKDSPREITLSIPSKFWKDGVSRNSFTIKSEVWQPSELGSKDVRVLGIAVEKIEFERS